MNNTMDEFCRGCLNNFNDPTELLQYTEERRRLFVYSTGLQVKRNDLFTFQLCKECYFSMKTSCKFKKMCRTSDRKIKSYLALKDVDEEGMDFSSFLKKHEESLTFRLPLLSGGTTPANQKAKDDDNESTCTSIQNFMTDILKEDEIPDSEARIIWEVIKEEADVLEDSLDSHWLQDDVSVDSDFQLNLSPSQFSTPRSTNNNRMCSSGPREVTSTDITSGEDYDNIPIDSTLKQNTDPVDSSYVIQNVLGIGMHSDTSNRCVIDKNLENALRDENNKEISLQELLVSPSEFHNTSGASTPTIKNILFGENLNAIKKVKSPNFGNDVDLLINELNNKTSSGAQVNKENFNRKKLIKEKGNSGFKQLLMEKDTLNEDNLKLIQCKKDNNLSMNLNIVQEDNVVLEESGLLQNIKSKEDINTGKMQEEKIDLLGKLLMGIEPKESNVESKLNKMTEKIYNEDDVESFSKNLIDDNLFSGIEKNKFKNAVKVNTDNLNMGKVYDHVIDLGLNNVGKTQSGKAEKRHVELDLQDLNIDLLLEDKAENSEINTNKILKSNLETGKINAIFLQKGTLIQTLNKDILNEDATDEILKEFLDTDEGKSYTGKKQKDFPSSGSVAQMDDAELTELLEDTYTLNKGKKLLDIQSSDKNKDIKRSQKNQRYLDKKMKSLLENKYCVTNFYCKMCDKKFKNLKYLKAHFLRCHKYKIQTPKQSQKIIKTCHLCGKSFTHIKSFTIHMENHEKPEEYHCGKCFLIFKTETALNSHMSTHGISLPVRVDSNMKYICNICGAHSNSASNLLTHKRRHLKNYTMHCDECGRGFYRKTELEIHLRSHTGEKPFRCNYCDKTFARRDTLNRHHKLHTDEKLFGCHNCDRKFTRRYDLKNHNCLKAKDLDTIPIDQK